MNADGRPGREYRLAEVREVRLEFSPTRVEPVRYRCTVTLRTGERLVFFNRTYTGVMQFRPTDAAFRVWVTALLEHVARRAPAARFVAGATKVNYVVGAIGGVVIVLCLMVVLVFLLRTGAWSLVVLKAALIVFYLPTAWRWLRRNRAGTFDPRRPPPEVLPASETPR